MFQSIKSLQETLDQYESALLDNHVAIDDIISHLDHLIQLVAKDPQIHRKGESMNIALEAAFEVSLNAFRIIDKGDHGLDDKLVAELTKIRTKYLGQK